MRGGRREEVSDFETAVCVIIDAMQRPKLPALGLRRADPGRDARIRAVIRSIPRGRVATYAQVAGAAGYPLHHRLVARLLRQSGDALPWQRVLGAGGEIRLRLDAALEQRTRLELEGVKFRGKRVNMDAHQHRFRTWEIE